MVPKHGGKENTRTITVLKTFFYLNPLVNSYMTKVARKNINIWYHTCYTHQLKNITSTLKELKNECQRDDDNNGRRCDAAVSAQSLSDIVAFCAIAKIRETTTAEKRHRELSHCNIKERIQAKTISQLKNTY